MKSNEIKNPVSGINDATSYVRSCHISLTSCDSGECVEPYLHLHDSYLLGLLWQGMNCDIDSPEDHPEKLLYYRFWTPLTHASYQKWLLHLLA